MVFIVLKHILRDHTETNQDFSTLPGYLLIVEFLCPVAQEGEYGGLAVVDDFSYACLAGREVLDPE